MNWIDNDFSFIIILSYSIYHCHFEKKKEILEK